MSFDAAAYFATSTQAPEAGTEGTWVDTNADVRPIELVPGLVFRPLLGTGLALNVVEFQPHTEAPVHSHEEEQITYVLEGEFEFEVNGEKRWLRPGMGVAIPPHAQHGARTFDSRCVEIDVFHPPRRGLLAAMRADQDNGTDAGA